MKVKDLINFENEIAGLFNQGKIRAPIHLYSNNETDGLFSTPLTFALFYPLMGFAAVLFVISLYSFEFKFPKLLTNVISYVSITSYSNYLWHMLLFKYLNSLSEYFLSYHLVTIFFVASFFTAGVSYLILEKPFLRLRDRLVP